MMTWISVCVNILTRHWAKAPLCTFICSLRGFRFYLGGITARCVNALLQKSLIFMLPLHKTYFESVHCLNRLFQTRILKHSQDKKPQHIVSVIFSLLCFPALWQIPWRPPGSQWDRRVLQGAHATTRAGSRVQALFQQRLGAFHCGAARLPGRPGRGRLTESRSKSHTHLRVQCKG